MRPFKSRARAFVVFGIFEVSRLLDPRVYRIHPRCGVHVGALHSWEILRFPGASLARCLLLSRRANWCRNCRRFITFSRALQVPYDWREIRSTVRKFGPPYLGERSFIAARTFDLRAKVLIPLARTIRFPRFLREGFRTENCRRLHMLKKCVILPLKICLRSWAALDTRKVTTRIFCILKVLSLFTVEFLTINLYCHSFPCACHFLRNLCFIFHDLFVFYLRCINKCLISCLSRVLSN